MQLVYVINKWLKSMDKGRATCAVFVDFVKAFDRVWHAGLLLTLAAYGVLSANAEWFRNYLSHRAISICVGDILSEPKHVDAGVPQGSHLGPVMFLIFINDLPEHVCIPSKLYADDALLHHEQLVGSIDPLHHNAIQDTVLGAEAWAT